MKKHKAWAQCSGVRNPAEYRKRADLATPSSIDKDFNFIAGVERSITRADENVVDRGIHLALARQLKAIDARPKVDMEIEERGVKVIKAPKGLSRSKTNKTHWANQQKGVMWTIEWVCPDGEKIMGHALETRKIEEAFVNTVGKKKIIQKRKMSLEEHAPESSSPTKLVRQEPTRALAHSEDRKPGLRDHSTAISQNAGVAPVPTKKDPAAGLYFYLHKPTTPSRFKCLIPLSRDQTLRSALEGRTVLEYPTIFMRDVRPEELQEPYMTEEEYMTRFGEDITVPILATLEEGEIEEKEAASLPAQVDTEKVLEVLARDLAG